MISQIHQLDKRQFTNASALFQKKQRLYFDIETTGFSRSSCMIYLIGCAYQDEEGLKLIQYLAESKEEEEMLLKYFLQQLSSFRELVSFNGLSFDLPFIEARCRRYGLEFQPSAYSSSDLYKNAQALRFLLRLDSYKQKTVEHYFGIRREDLCSGGELVQVYQDFCQNHDKEELNLLLLHNLEDVKGLLHLTVLENYTSLLDGKLHVDGLSVSNYEGADKQLHHDLFLSFHPEQILPRRITCQYQGLYLLLSEEGCILRLPILEGELRHYYPDYRNYYYLPLEDRAIHKSVAAFVDKEHREKCNAENCYIRKEGLFLPQMDHLTQPEFYINRKDPISYYELTQEMLEDENFMDACLNRSISWIFQQT